MLLIVIYLNIQIINQTNNFSKLILKSKDAKATATIFSSGKMICSGAKTEKQSKSICVKFGKIVKKIGLNAELKNFKIQNIVASYDVKFVISSDAHKPEKVGRYAKSMMLALSAGIGADRIVNIEEAVS